MAVLLITAFLFSCNKEENPMSDQIPASELKCGAVFTVAPSGNYEDDSYNIQAALNNAIAAGKGSTLKLTEGTFYLKYKIETDGFDGYIRGAGKQKTILTTHDQIDWSLPPLADNFCLITFRHGYVRMSDITFNITETEPCLSDFENALPTIIGISGSSSSTPPAGDQCGSSVFNNIAFISNSGNWFGYNVGGFINIGADRTEFIIGGNQKINNCLFQGSVNSITNWGDNNAKWVVGGNGSSGNTFKDAYWPLTMGEFNGSTAEISFNHFEKCYWGPIFITQGYFSDPANKALSTFFIHHNAIKIEDECDGISLIDETNYEGFGKSISAIVSNNEISMKIDGAFGGIFGYAADNIIVKNNKIWGEGMAGIYSGINGDQTTGWLIMGNNVQKVEAVKAPIWLGPGTSNYLVSGGSIKTTVLDEGTNNTLIGCNKVKNGFRGYQMKKVPARSNEMMRMFKNHSIRK